MNLVGQKFNKLTVLSEHLEGRHTYCICRCDCGNIKRIRKDALGRTQCCGCDKIKHKDLKYPRIYKIWESMHARCECPAHASYKDYKDKPICEEWHRIPNRKRQTGFLNFYKWAMENGYQDSLTLDRIDNSKGYCPENCRWVTNIEQARNTTRNRNITYNGKTQCLRAWCDELGLSYIAVQHCLARYSLTPEQVLDRYTKQRFNVKLQRWEDK